MSYWMLLAHPGDCLSFERSFLPGLSYCPFSFCAPTARQYMGAKPMNRINNTIFTPFKRGPPVGRYRYANN